MSFGTRVHTWLFGEYVGADQFGNRYYIDKRTKGQKRERRWVMYNGEVEASRVPPEWHAWLHHIVAEPPPPGPPARRPWQKEHVPNLTGTPLAYRPPGHDYKGGARAATTGD